MSDNIWIKVDELPSNYKYYEKDTVIEFRPYKYNEIKKLSNGSISNAESEAIIQEGIRLNTCEVKDLILADYYYLTILRTLESQDTTEYRIGVRTPMKKANEKLGDGEEYIYQIDETGARAKDENGKELPPVEGFKIVYHTMSVEDITFRDFDFDIRQYDNYKLKPITVASQFLEHDGFDGNQNLIYKHLVSETAIEDIEDLSVKDLNNMLDIITGELLLSPYVLIDGKEVDVTPDGIIPFRKPKESN